MKKILLLFLFTSLLKLNFAQRCGYDFVNAFLVKFTDGPNFPVKKGIEAVIINDQGDTLISFHQKNQKENHEWLKHHFKWDEDKELHVFFFDNRLIPQNAKNPIWLQVKYRPNYRHVITYQNLKQHKLKSFADSVFLIPMHFSESNYLCGHSGPFKVLKFNLRDTPSKVSVLPKKDVLTIKKQPEIVKIYQVPTPIISPTTQLQQNLPNIKGQQVKRTQEIKQHFTFTDSLFLVNYSQNTCDLPDFKLMDIPNESSLEVNILKIPQSLSPKDTEWVVYQVKSTPDFHMSPEGLPVKSIAVAFQLAFNQKEVLTLKSDYLLIFTDHLESKDTVYRFKTHAQHWFWQLEVQDHQLKSYGPCQWIKDSLVRVGNWYFTEPRNMITYSQRFEFYVEQASQMVTPETKIYKIHGAQKIRLPDFLNGTFKSAWIEPGVDTLYFEYGPFSNYLMKFNHLWTHQVRVEVFRKDTLKYFLKRYPQIQTYQSYEFIDTLYLLKWNSSNDPNKIKQKLHFESEWASNLTLNSGSLDHLFQYLNFPLRDKKRLMAEINQALQLGVLDRVYQGVKLNQKEGFQFLTGEITLRPKSFQWTAQEEEALGGVAYDKHSFGDGTFQLKSSSKIIEESWFENQFPLIKHTVWQYASPGFFHPIKMVED